jgi:hypothetical protein
LFLPCSISSSELLIITKLRFYATGRSMPQKRYIAQNLLTNDWYIPEKKLKSTKNCNTSKNACYILIQKIIKTAIKHIAYGPAGVVQYRLLARSCIPLRVLFIRQLNFILIYNRKYYH